MEGCPTIHPELQHARHMVGTTSDAALASGYRDECVRVGVPDGHLRWFIQHSPALAVFRPDVAAGERGQPRLPTGHSNVLHAEEYPSCARFPDLRIPLAHGR